MCGVGVGCGVCEVSEYWMNWLSLCSYIRYWRGVLLFAFLLLFSSSVLFMSYRTYTRNREWVDDKRLFEAAVVTCPRSAKMHKQLGQVCVSCVYVCVSGLSILSY